MYLFKGTLISLLKLKHLEGSYLEPHVNTLEMVGKDYIYNYIQ